MVSAGGTTDADGVSFKDAASPARAVGSIVGTEGCGGVWVGGGETTGGTTGGVIGGTIESGVADKEGSVTGDSPGGRFVGAVCGSSGIEKALLTLVNRVLKKLSRGN